MGPKETIPEILEVLRHPGMDLRTIAHMNADIFESVCSLNLLQLEESNGAGYIETSPPPMSIRYFGTLTREWPWSTMETIRNALPSSFVPER